ncbi:MAG: RNA 2',3'-cyclic phosphodiesterase [Ignavibacteriae bacterium HGW-Ignavibacteriae-3]|nr:MAG: RNA 2',3'-cyclic phosphodiesterase [Ignavibacteriae bacterium HGW-Ignavibacteriae-3]
MKIRAFIALDVPEKSIADILKIRDEVAGSSVSVKWEPKEKLHLTLKFLGDIDSELIGNYSRTLENILKEYEPFELSFSEFGLFRRGQELKILWLGLKENTSLSSLVGDIENQFIEFGFPKEERKFKSHITLLRFRGYEDSKKIVSLTEVKLPELKFKSDSVTLYESRLMPGGSVYRSLKKLYLKN